MVHAKHSPIIAVCGRKNAGKTTLITRILPYLCERGLAVATIKHDGHDFEADIPGTDTRRHSDAGAYATAIYSDYRYMLVKKCQNTDPKDLAGFFPEADLILLEGGKNSSYPKIEVIRSAVSRESCCSPANLLAIATDLDGGIWPDVPLLNLDDPRAIADFILSCAKL